MTVAVRKWKLVIEGQGEDPAKNVNPAVAPLLEALRKTAAQKVSTYSLDVAGQEVASNERDAAKTGKT